MRTDLSWLPDAGQIALLLPGDRARREGALPQRAPARVRPSSIWRSCRSRGSTATGHCSTVPGSRTGCARCGATSREVVERARGPVAVGTVPDRRCWSAPDATGAASALGGRAQLKPPPSTRATAGGARPLEKPESSIPSIRSGASSRPFRSWGGSWMTRSVILRRKPHCACCELRGGSWRNGFPNSPTRRRESSSAFSLATVR